MAVVGIEGDVLFYPLLSLLAKSAPNRRPVQTCIKTDLQLQTPQPAAVHVVIKRHVALIAGRYDLDAVRLQDGLSSRIAKTGSLHIQVLPAAGDIGGRAGLSRWRGVGANLPIHLIAAQVAPQAADKTAVFTKPRTGRLAVKILNQRRRRRRADGRYSQGAGIGRLLSRTATFAHIKIVFGIGLQAENSLRRAARIEDGSRTRGEAGRAVFDDGVGTIGPTGPIQRGKGGIHLNQNGFHRRRAKQRCKNQFYKQQHPQIVLSIIAEVQLPAACGIAAIVELIKRLLRQIDADEGRLPLAYRELRAHTFLQQIAESGVSRTRKIAHIAVVVQLPAIVGSEQHDLP